MPETRLACAHTVEGGWAASEKRGREQQENATTGADTLLHLTVVLLLVEPARVDSNGDGDGDR